MIKYLLWLCGFSTFFPAFGQFTDSTTHLVWFDATGNYNRTNGGTAFLLNQEGRFSIKNKRTVFNAFSGWVYGAQNGKRSNNDVLTTVDFNLYRDSSHLYYWGLANYTSSFSLRIRNQLQSGFGVAYNVSNTAAFWLNLSNGIIYETSSLRATADGYESYNTFRNSFRLSFRLAVKKFSITGVHFLQNSLRYKQDYIVRSSTGVALKINKWVSLNTSFVYNQFRRTSSENVLFTYGLSAQRYF